MKRLFFLISVAAAALAVAACGAKETPEASWISLDRSDVTITDEASVQLNATVHKSTGAFEDNILLWTSSDPEVASVTGGLVKPLNNGTATIKVMTLDGFRTATCQVTVARKKMASIVLSYDDGEDPTDHYTVARTNTQFNAKLLRIFDPEDAFSTSNRIVSSDQSVIAVEDKIVYDGSRRSVCTLVGTGTCDLYAEALDGSSVKSNTVRFTVVDNITFATKLNMKTTIPYMVVGETLEVPVEVYPADANSLPGARVSVSGSNASALSATLDLDRMLITVKALSAVNNAVISTSVSGGSTQSQTFNIHTDKPALSVNLPEQDGKVSDGRIVLYPNETFDLSSCVSKSSSVSALSYSVREGSSYAGVSGAGVVTCKGAGDAVIRVASSSDASVYAEVQMAGQAAPSTAPELVEHWLDGHTWPLDNASNPLHCKRGGQTQITVTNCWTRGEYEFTFSDAVKGRISVTETRRSGDKLHVTLSAQAGTAYASGTMKVAPKGYPALSRTIGIRLCKYSYMDAKPGDLLSRYHWKDSFFQKTIDNGLREEGVWDSHRFSKVAASSDLNNVVGIVCWGGTPVDEGIGLRLHDLPQTRLGGTAVFPVVHGYALSLYEPSACEFSEDFDDVAASGNWSADMPVKPTAKGKYAYSFYLGYSYYNNRRGNSHDAKPYKRLADIESKSPLKSEPFGWWLPTVGEWEMLFSQDGFTPAQFNEIGNALSSSAFRELGTNNLYHTGVVSEDSRNVWCAKTGTGGVEIVSQAKSTPARVRGLIAF